jgi:hypothetical protein
MILIGEQELHLKEKQRRAEEKRNIKLNERVRKAQEEEAKVWIIDLMHNDAGLSNHHPGNFDSGHFELFNFPGR